jgi:putative aminopeptidase FrvX
MDPLDLLKIPTAPHFEDSACDFVCKFLNRHKILFRKDKYGNIIAAIGPKKGQGVAFAAHLDHPGFQVLSVKKREVKCVFLGGVMRDYFRRGVPIDFFDRNGKKTGVGRMVRVLQWNPLWQERYSRRMLIKLERGTVDNHSFGMWQLPVLAPSRTHIINRVCDDMAGCAAMLETLKRLSRVRLSNRVYALITRREEIGLQGAYEIARARALPRSVPVISIENSKELCNAKQGNGVIIRVGDKLSIFDPKVTQEMCRIGEMLKKKKKILYQRRLMDGGTCEATAFLQEGYRAGGVCLALGNYHNCGPNFRIKAENVHRGDWLGLVELLVETGKSFKLSK